ncbi:MAG TPA: YkgJ family cysteine cluster protein, partial [Polyangiales bacterium]
MSEALPECLVCGACCFGQGERYVPVSGDDHARLGDQAEAYTQFIGNRCYMRMHQGHCAALQVAEDGRFVCQVYASRPTTCRDLARGGGACRAEFEQKRAVATRAQLHVLQAHEQAR